MKRLACLLLLTLLPAAIAAGGISAKDAVRTVGRERGAAYLNRLVQIIGENGADQPAAWRIIAADSQGTLREFFVSDRGILAEGPVPPAAAPQINGPRIPLKSVAIDSTQAFGRAEAAARSARVGFNSINYRLRCLELSTNPAWFLQLNDVTGRKVGEVTVSAGKGTVLRTQWFPRGATPPQDVGRGTPPASSQAEELWYRTRDVAGRGATAVKNGLNRAGNWIRDKVNPQPPLYYVPPRSGR